MPAYVESLNQAGNDIYPLCSRDIASKHFQIFLELKRRRNFSMVHTNCADAYVLPNLRANKFVEAETAKKADFQHFSSML